MSNKVTNREDVLQGWFKVCGVLGRLDAMVQIGASSLDVAACRNELEVAKEQIGAGLHGVAR